MSHTHLDVNGDFVGKHGLGPGKIGFSFKDPAARWALRLYALLAWQKDPGLSRDILAALSRGSSSKQVNKGG